MKKILLIVSAILVAGCTDLDVKPRSSATADLVLGADLGPYRSFLAKLYGGLMLTGQQGPAGNGDIQGIDEGESNYLRNLWNFQELTTDEAVIKWNDKTIQDLHAHKWTSQDGFINAFYNRIFYQIALSNEFLRESTESKLSGRGASATVIEEVAKYRADARFLRALSYWHALDMFGDIPLLVEGTSSTTLPTQASRLEVFEFIESEINDIIDVLPAPKEGETGRADQGAAWTLLAKLYLNANTYIGETRFDECIEACLNVIESGAYSIEGTYHNLFKIGNENSDEVIFAALSDGNFSQSYGGTTFLVHASIWGDRVTPASVGVDSDWNGLRTTAGLVDLFQGSDARSAIIVTTGLSKLFTDKPNAAANTEGFIIPKFQNKTPGGSNGSNLTFVDVDFPLFRLADVYLMYAEAILRGGAGGNAGEALDYINELQERAELDPIDMGDMTLDFIIDERGRELFWEGHRRTDLIRFDLFTDSDEDDPRALWQWKGDALNGIETSDHLELFPIPAAQLVANPKLKQNSDLY